MDYRVIPPTTVTEAMLVSSTAPETDYTVWAFGAFVEGDRRIMTTGIHKVYECLVDHTSTDANGAPNLNVAGTELGGATPNWIEVSSTNRWKMFDSSINSQTLIASPLTVVFKPGPCTSINFFELLGAQADVSIKDVSGGTVVYTNTKNLDGSDVYDGYSYCFGPFEQLETWVLTDLPPYPNMEITITITGTGTVGCGVCVVGLVYELGDAEWDAVVGIKDYTLKIADAWGVITTQERGFLDTLDVTLQVPRAQHTRVKKRLASLRARACVWIATDDADFELLIVYGFFNSYQITVPEDDVSRCALQLEGLVQL